MPAPRKRVVHHAPVTSSAQVGDALLAEQPQQPAPDDAAPPPPKPRRAKHIDAAPAPAADDSTGNDGGLPLSLAPEEPHPVEKPKPHKRVASTEPPPAAASSATGAVVAAQQTPGVKSNLNKQSEILFPRGASDLGNDMINKMRAVASQLNTLLGAGASRVELDAFGGPPGDKSSDSRRLSLKRALVIRQLLIEDGVPADRIDVRAMGGIDDSGAPDRVDVLVRAS
jgi:outer membrane protein OmpA-like peptidoglycan-associated protein